MKRNIFVKIFSNIVIFSILTSIFIFAFSGSGITTGGENDEAPIYRGNTQKNNISLIFSVYYGAEYIEPILEILKSNEIETTFFIGGNFAEKNSELLKKIHNGGHEIGNQGYFNIDHKKADTAKNKEEIVVCEKMIESIIKIKTKLFLPPRGSFSAVTLQVCKNLDYKPILWSKDARKIENDGTIYSRATKNIKNGEFILMQPDKQTVDDLTSILQFYSNSGFNVTTVSKCLI